MQPLETKTNKILHLHLLIDIFNMFHQEISFRFRQFISLTVFNNASCHHYHHHHNHHYHHHHNHVPEKRRHGPLVLPHLLRIFPASITTHPCTPMTMLHTFDLSLKNVLNCSFVTKNYLYGQTSHSFSTKGALVAVTVGGE